MWHLRDISSSTVTRKIVSAGLFYHTSLLKNTDLWYSGVVTTKSPHMRERKTARTPLTHTRRHQFLHMPFLYEGRRERR